MRLDRHEPATDRRSISRTISPRSRRRACCSASTGRSTRTPSCIRWCAGSSRAASPKTSGARSCSPTWSTRPAAATTSRSRSARWRPRRASTRSAWDARSRRSRRRGSTPSPIRLRRSPLSSPPCQEVVLKGDDLRGAGKGLARLPVPISTPGFDAAPYLTATLCVTRDPETGIQNMGTYRGALKATDRLGVRMASRIGGAGGYLHWKKYNKRREPMPCAIVIGCAPVAMFTGGMKLADRSRRDGGGRRACRRADPDGQSRHRRPQRAGRRRDRDRRTDRSRPARAGRPVRRKPRPRRARRLQHVDAA